MKNADSKCFTISLAVAVLVLVACSSKSEPVRENVGSQVAALSALTNQIGRLTTSGNSDRRTTFNYDSLGRGKAVAHAMEGAEYVYTSQYGYPRLPLGPSDTEAGTVLQSTRLPDGEIVGYEYDSGGAQQKVTAGGTPIVTQVRRNAKGQSVSVVHGNGVESEHRYNDQGDLRLRQIVSTHRPSGRVLQAYEYDFDGEGNVKQIRDYCNPDTDQCPCDPTPGASCTPNRLSRAFDYDDMDRLVQVRAPAGMSIAGLPRSYAYDAIDNLTQKDGFGQTYGADSKPHALAWARDVSYHYDANGNLTSTSAGLSLVWNSQNMPVLTVNGGQRVRKTFLGEAVWKKTEGDVTTYYLPAIRIENGRLRKYYGGYAERDPDANGALRFYHGDHLGSSTLVTDASGNVVHRAAYLPYGEDDPSFTRQNAFTPKYQFNYKEKERATGLIDYGARMYNPAIGRWISPDTSNADGLNRYAYVQNNPVTLIDPDGHQTKKPQNTVEPHVVRTEQRDGIRTTYYSNGMVIEEDYDPRRERAIQDFNTVTRYIGGSFSQTVPGAAFVMKPLMGEKIDAWDAVAVLTLGRGGTAKTAGQWFWTKGTQKVAEGMAKSSGGRVIEMSFLGAIANKLNPAIQRFGLSDAVWGRLSRAWARSASGTVNIVTRAYKEGDQWVIGKYLETEIKTLMTQNPKVTEAIIHVVDDAGKVVREIAVPMVP